MCNMFKDVIEVCWSFLRIMSQREKTHVSTSYVWKMKQCVSVRDICVCVCVSARLYYFIQSWCISSCQGKNLLLWFFPYVLKLCEAMICLPSSGMLSKNGILDLVFFPFFGLIGFFKRVLKDQRCWWSRLLTCVRFGTRPPDQRVPKMPGAKSGMPPLHWWFVAQWYETNLWLEKAFWLKKRSAGTAFPIWCRCLRRRRATMRFNPLSRLKKSNFSGHGATCPFASWCLASTASSTATVGLVLLSTTRTWAGPSPGPVGQAWLASACGRSTNNFNFAWGFGWLFH